MRHEIEQIALGIQAIRREITERPSLAEVETLKTGVVWIHTMMAIMLEELWTEIKRIDPAARKTDLEIARISREMLTELEEHKSEVGER